MSHEIETFLPVWIAAAGALWSDAETEVLSLLGCIGEGVSHRHVFLAIYRDTASLTEEDTQRPDEPLILHQIINLHALSPGVQLAEDKVPVAGMGRKADNKLVRMLYRDILGPPHLLVQEPLKESTHHLCTAGL